MLESIFSNLTPNYCESIDKPYLQVMIEEEGIQYWMMKMEDEEYPTSSNWSTGQFPRKYLQSSFNLNRKLYV